MQFKAIIIALAAVGSAVANPIENGANAPSAAEMQSAAYAYAKANINNIPDAKTIKAAADFKDLFPDFGFFHDFPDPYPCCGKQWGFFDWYNLFCYQNYPKFYPTWSTFCYQQPIVNSCAGLFGCCSGLLSCIL